MVGEETDLNRNLLALIEAAGLTDDEVREFRRLQRERIRRYSNCHSCEGDDVTDVGSRRRAGLGDPRPCQRSCPLRRRWLRAMERREVAAGEAENATTDARYGRQRLPLTDKRADNSARYAPLLTLGLQRIGRDSPKSAALIR